MGEDSAAFDIAHCRCIPSRMTMTGRIPASPCMQEGCPISAKIVADWNKSDNMWREAWGTVYHRCHDFDEFEQSMLAQNVYSALGHFTMEDCADDLDIMPSLIHIVRTYIQRSS